MSEAAAVNGDVCVDEADGRLFLTEAFDLMVDEILQKGTDRKEKVCEWKDPDELKNLLDLELRDHGESHQKLLQRVRDVARYSVKTCHPRFFNQLFAGLDYHALTGRLLTETLNTSQYTYEVAPVFVLMEEEVLRQLRALIGWPDGDGTFCPGGSVSNMYGMNVARHRAFPQVKTQGLWAAPRLAVFTSRQSHYSMKKAAALLGLGTDSVFLVDVDDSGRMIPEDLEAKITQAKSQGAVPFFINATAGTTVQGAFDPLNAVADVSQRHGAWLHVDAAWGGSVMFSRRHRHLLSGIERADSVTWNPHKMLLAGLQCSVVLFRDTTKLLMKCHSASATYLFQQDKFYNTGLDTGDKSLQCGRRVDCLKLWLLWKAVGGRGLERRVDKAFALASYLVAEMKKRRHFQLVCEGDFVNICFWFIPPSLRGTEKSDDYQEKLAKVAPVIKERMVKSGSLMVGYQPLDGHVNFFRMVVVSPQLSSEDMDFVLDEVERLGRDL